MRQESGSGPGVASLISSGSPANEELTMTIMRFTARMTATPEQFIAALTDFGEGREKVWGNSANSYLKVLAQDSAEADVTEGSSGVWETLHYDWSDPRRVVLTTTDSNTWAGTSGWTYTFTPQPDGTTDVDVEVVREGKNLKGRGLALALGAGGKRVLEKRFAATVKAIDAISPRPGI
jgi:Polyketide cyclase / dehydrase and lipid transport